MGTQARKSRYLPLLIGGIAALMAWRPVSTGDSGDTTVLQETQARKSRYLPLLIGGIAALMAWHPASTGYSGDTIVLHDSTGLSAKALALTAHTARRQAKARANSANRRCAECGVVVSMEETKGYGDDFGIDAAGGGGDADQQARRLNLMTRYEIIVRMADGSHSAINQASPASWRLGERVIVIAGTIPPHR